MPSSSLALLRSITWTPALIENIRAEARTDYRYWRAHLEPLLDLRKGLGEALQAVADATGVPYNTVKRRFLRYRKLGPAGLLELRLCGREFWATLRERAEPDATKSAGLVELWKRLCEESHRSLETAHRNLCKMWKKRDAAFLAIPEYREFPNWPKLPKGWSLDNLRAIAPSEFELVAARQGLEAASLKRSTVFTSRAELYVGSHYMFDDKWHDMFVNDLVRVQAGRPLEVYSLDLFSAYKVAWGFRIRNRDDKGSYEGIGEVMTRYIAASTLHTVGYSPRGTTCVTEAGTAKMREALARILYDNTGGKISIDEGAVRSSRALLHHYPSLAKGNPRHKAALESNNNLEHNRFDFLPGQTGRNVAERPAQLAGMLKYNATLLAAYSQLPEEKQALFDASRFPLLERNQWADLAAHIYANIADDRSHNLSDWVESGHVLQAIEIGGQIVPVPQLTPQQREALPQMLDAGLVKSHPLRMTRREAFNRGRGDLIKLPGWGVVAILGDDLARECIVRDGMIQIQDTEISPSPLRYEATLRPTDALPYLLRDREKYQVFANPFAPDTLFVRDAQGRYLGECARIVSASRADVQAIDEAIKRATKHEAEALAPSRARHAAAAKARRDQHRANAQTFGAEIKAESKATRIKAETAANLIDARYGTDSED